MQVFKILVLFVTMTAPTWAQSRTPLHMEIHTARNFNDQQYEKLMRAKQLVELIINSEAFRNRVLAFTYQGKEEYVQNGGMSNFEVYEYLMRGAERFPAQTNVDNEMDYDLVLYKPKWYQSRRVLGYTSRDTNLIHINKLFYNDADVNQIASNLVHEWLHKLGFEHDFKRTARRPYSVPYAIGYMVRDLGNKILGTENSELNGFSFDESQCLRSE